MLVSMVRFLAITHIIVGALLFILGLADGVTSVLGGDKVDEEFFSLYGFFGLWTGTWVSVQRRNSSFVRYELTYSTPSQPFYFLAFLPARRGEKKSTFKKSTQNATNCVQFSRQKAFGS